MIFVLDEGNRRRGISVTGAILYWKVVLNRGFI